MTAASSVESQSGVLRDPTDEALAAAIEASTVEYWRTCCAYMPGAEFYDGPEMTWFVTGISHAPWFNQVLMTRLATGDVERRIEEMLALFKNRRLPMLWSVGHSARAADLGRLLEARGMTQTTKMAGMAVGVETVADGAPLPADFAIARVRDAGTLERWLHAYVNAFGMPELAGRSFFDLYATIGFSEGLPFRHYVGLLGREPVASSTLFLGAGVAGVWHVGTVPAARRKGIGSAMSLAPLRDARALGYRVGTLYASDMGLGVYRRLGFAEYGALVQYRWVPEG